MFEIMNDPYVSAMLNLSKTNCDEFEVLQVLKPLDINKLFSLCTEHELDGLVGNRISKFTEIELPEKWKNRMREQRAKLLFFKERTIHIAEVLAKEGIKLVVLKNGGIMLGMMDDPLDCPMGDIDTLISRADFLHAHKILLQEGFTLKFRSEYEANDIENAFAHGSAEYFYGMPNGDKMWFELSWRPIDGRWIRRELEPDADELLARAVKNKDSNAYILSSEDNLLQVCAHTAKHSYVRAPGLRLHLDVERIVSLNDIDWKIFLKSAKEVHVKTACYYSLYIAKQLFDISAIPDEVLRQLEPSPKKRRNIERLLSKASLLHPREIKFSRLGYIKLHICLYDTFEDFLSKAFPPSELLYLNMESRKSIYIPWYWITYILDLIGIRKSKISDM